MPEGLSYQMFEQYYNRAKEADQAGRLAEAKKLYLSASEALYRAAKEVTGETRQKLLNRAEKLEALADGIKVPKVVAPAAKPAGNNKAASGAAASGGKSGQEKASSNNGDESETIWTPSLNPNVHFDDIAGLNDVKEAINTRIILPRKYPEVYEAYHRSLNGGILLYGPPGTGKTMIAKAIATEVGAAFFSIRCSDIVGKYFGEAEKNVKGLFEAARSHEAAIIFFDEFEALAARRGGNSTVMNRLVPELLSQIDGFTTSKENKTLLLLAATNRPWDLDTAFLRPPRLTEKIYVGLPDEPAREYLIHKKLDKVPRAEDFDFAEAVALTEGYNAADVTEFCESVKDGGIHRTLYENDGKVLSKICRQDVLDAAERIRSSVQESDLVAIRKWEETQK